jgi:hypothetical protein
LVHLYQTPSLLPGHLHIVASSTLRLLYLLLYDNICLICGISATFKV